MIFARLTCRSYVSSSAWLLVIFERSESQRCDTPSEQSPRALRPNVSCFLVIACQRLLIGGLLNKTFRTKGISLRSAAHRSVINRKYNFWRPLYQRLSSKRKISNLILIRHRNYIRQFSRVSLAANVMIWMPNVTVPPAVSLCHPISHGASLSGERVNVQGRPGTQLSCDLDFINVSPFIVASLTGS